MKKTFAMILSLSLILMLLAGCGYRYSGGYGE